MVWQQSRRQGEPLLPVELFRDRNFALANVSITAMAFSITAFVLQAMFYAQAVRGVLAANGGDGLPHPLPSRRPG